MSKSWGQPKLLLVVLSMALVTVAASSTLCFAANVDWKLYGGTSAGSSQNNFCFYEEKSIAKPKPGYVRVWVKCLLQKDLDAITPDKSYYRAVIDMSASRIAHYYMPPLLKVERMNADQAMEVTSYEAVADVSDLKPVAQIFYELDCTQRKMREPSITVAAQSSNAPLEWKDVPPEGNGSNLLSLLCSAH